MSPIIFKKSLDFLFIILAIFSGFVISDLAESIGYSVQAYKIWFASGVIAFIFICID